MPAELRYRHFIKQVADRQVVWGLYKDGWAMAKANSGRYVFPVWPAPEYAELCAAGDWEGYASADIPLDDFLNELVPNLDKDDVPFAVAYLPHDLGVVIDSKEVESDIREELESYE